MFFLLWLPVSLIFLLQNDSNPVDTRRRFNVNKTSIKRRWRRVDVETSLCVYWEDKVQVF